MPRMNGIEFLHAVRDTPAARIPIVAFTGDAGAANNALRAGAVACLRKPVEPRAVLDAIRSRLGDPGASALAAPDR
jgi:CheY-like chemotaxis protein